MIVPFGPSVFDYSLLKQQAKILLNNFPRAIGVRFTNNFSEEYNDGKYYVVLTKRPVDLDALSSKKRHDFISAKKNCSVVQLDANYIAENGYLVYRNALKRYRYGHLYLTDNVFKKMVLSEIGYGDIVHYWGVFYANKLVGFAKNYCFGRELKMSSLKFDPEYLKFDSSIALIHGMTEYYLRNKNFLWMTAGFTSISHDSNFNSYLIDKFNFYKAKVRLEVFYKPIVGRFISMTFKYRGFLKFISHDLGTLYKQEEMRGF